MRESARKLRNEREKNVETSIQFQRILAYITLMHTEWFIYDKIKLSH